MQFEYLTWFSLAQDIKSETQTSGTPVKKYVHPLVFQKIFSLELLKSGSIKQAEKLKPNSLENRLALNTDMKLYFYENDEKL